MPRPTYSRRARRSTRRRSTPWYNRRYSTLQLAKKAWSATKYLKGIINSEKHIADQNHTSTARNATFRIVNLAQGIGPDQRQGNSILLKSIYLRGQIEINSSVTSNTRYTLLLVRDNQQVSDTNPTVGQIFEDATDAESMLSRASAGRFSVIWRTTSFLTPVAGGRPVALISKYIKLNKHVRWNGPNDTDLQKGGYYLCLLSSESVNFTTLNFNSRIAYYDN